MKITAIELGILLNSALYLAMVFTAGILMRSPLAWKLSAITVGLCYASYLAQDSYKTYPKPWVSLFAAALTVLSILAGIAAGVVLL